MPPPNAVVQNRPAERVYVFGTERTKTGSFNEAGGGESIELTNFESSTLSRRAHRSFNGKGPAFTKEGTSDYEGEVFHQVEQHHTLQGIALQFRVTVILLHS